MNYRSIKKFLKHERDLTQITLYLAIISLKTILLDIDF